MSIETLKEIREQLIAIRNLTEELSSSRAKDLEGLFNCGLIVVADAIEQEIQNQIKRDDNRFGTSLKFAPRGIGTDVCPGCFICGAKKNSMMPNIAAFVSSKEDGEKIVGWFDKKAKLDYRPHEPNWIQVKVGACENHISNLNKLYNATAVYGVIRHHDILVSSC